MRLRGDRTNQANPFLRVRLVAIFLMSATGVLLAQAAVSKVRLFEALIWTGILATATIAGAALFGRLHAMLEPTWRNRIRGTMWVAYGALLVYSFISLASHDYAGRAASNVMMLSAAQPLFLLLAGFGRGHVGAMRNALVLGVFAAAGGGATAASAMIGFAAFLIIFLVFDCHARKLSQFPVESVPSVAAAVRASLLYAVPAILGLAAWFSFVPPQPLAAFERQAVKWKPASREELFTAYRDLLIASLAGGVLVYVAIRFLAGRDRRAEVRIEAEVAPVRYAASTVRRAARPRDVADYAGWRGKIVKLYVDFLDQAAKLGVRRRPDHTPAEFAGQLAGSAPALAEIFERARYGPDDPGESDFADASRASGEILSHLREKRP